MADFDGGGLRPGSDPAPQLSAAVGVLPVANGGTASATAADARTALGTAASGVNTDLTALNDPTLTAGVVTAGTMTVGSSALLRSTVHKFSWTNAMIVALGASLTGDITICTLPAKTVVKRVWVIVTGQATGTTTLTLAVGRTSASYIDYIIAKDAKVAANTLYGGVVGDLGTNLTGYDLPSVAGTTAVKMHMISTVQTLDACLASTGDVFIETVRLP